MRKRLLALALILIPTAVWAATQIVPGGGGHDGTVTWTGTPVLETGSTLQFGDGSDATLTHTYNLTAGDPVVTFGNDNITFSTPINADSFTALASAEPALVLVDSHANAGEARLLLDGNAVGPDSLLDLQVDIAGTPTTFIRLDGINELLSIQDDWDFQTDGVIVHTETVNDDVCDNAGEWWYDTTDTRFEFCEASSGAPAVLGTSAGDITDVFDCSTGNCASIVVGATDLLNFSANDASTGTEGLILPQHATACSGGTSEGQVCWEADANILHIGDASTIVQFVPTSGFSSDIAVSTTGVVTIQSGAVGAGDYAADTIDHDDLNDTITFEDGSLLDFGTNISDATEGIFLPAHLTTCVSATGEGQVCWEEDAAALWIGDGSTAQQMNGAAPATEVRSMYWGAGSISADGTQCSNPAEVTINSGPKLFTIICTDNDASIMHGTTVMPDSWNAGTVTFELSYIQTAADTNVLNMDIAAQCKNNGTAVTTTFGTKVGIDDAAVVGSNSIDTTTSGAVTADGTCAAGDFLMWELELDATGTTTAVATLHFIGVKMEYTSDIGD